MADLSPKELDELKQLYKDLQNINIPNMDAFVKGFGGMDAARKNLQQMRQEFSNINSDVSYLSESLTRVLLELKGQNNALSLTKKSYSNISSIANKLKYDQDDISKLSKKDLETQGKKLGQERQRLELAHRINGESLASVENELKNASYNPSKIAALQKEKKALQDANKEVDDFLKNGLQVIVAENEKRLKQEEAITKNLGAMGAVFEGITGTLSKFGISSDIIKEMNDELRKAADNTEGTKVGFKTLFEPIKKGIKEALNDPLFRFALALKAVKSGFNDIKKAFDIFLEFDKVFTDTSRGLGMSVDQIHEMTNAAKFSGDQFGNNAYTAGQITKAIGESNAQLGLSVDLGAATTSEFAAMTNQMGLSAEESTKIYKLGLLNNMSLKDTNKTIASSIVAVQKQTGVQLNAKQIFQEIGKLSAGITAKFQQNPAALAQAVAQAKALGTNLEQVDKVGESLLNFESSIENELKAELLTGKQINLEKARYAALTGDQTTLTQELANQVGSLADFQGMNVIAQKSLAEAFGLSRDDVADMLTKQETFNKLGDVSGKSAAEQLAIAKERGISEEDSLMKNLQQQAAAEKLAATFDSLKVILAEMLTGPFSGLVDMMASLAKHSFLVKTAIFALATVSLAKTIGGLATMAVELGIASVGAAATAAAVTLGIGAIAIIAALSSIGSATSAATDKAKSDAQNVNDGIAPSSKGPFTITDSYGSTAVTAKGDGLAVSPNINRDSINKPMQPSFNTSAITDAISALSNTVSGLVNRPQATPQFALHVDGRQLGTAVGKQMETGTAQNIYTGYKVA
jgi:anti-sigma factor RsiW